MDGTLKAPDAELVAPVGYSDARARDDHELLLDVACGRVCVNRVASGTLRAGGGAGGAADPAMSAACRRSTAVWSVE